MRYPNKLFLLLVILMSSCEYPEIEIDKLVYDNNFEDKSLENITGGDIKNYNNNFVIGNFNNDGFTLHLNDLIDHEYVYISFDLYIHGSWDGNKNGFKINDKPDKWIMEINPYMTKNPDFDKFTTTFSNSPCFSNYCLRQSYPAPYPFENNPKSGSFTTNLPPICENSFFGGKTSLYKLEKGLRHSGKALVIRFYDELYQPNAIDENGVPQQKCDESWSLDNLKIRVIKYK